MTVNRLKGFVSGNVSEMGPRPADVIPPTEEHRL